MMTTWAPVPMALLLDGRVLGLSHEHRHDLLRMYFDANGTEHVTLHREELPPGEATWDKLFPDTLAPLLKELLRQGLIEPAPGGVLLTIQVTPRAFTEEEVRGWGVGPFVYVIGSASFDTVKIGYSANPWKRLQDLQQAQAEPLAIYGLMPGGEREERALHCRFADSRVRSNGEWFRITPELVRWCKQWGVRW